MKPAGCEQDNCYFSLSQEQLVCCFVGILDCLAWLHMTLVGSWVSQVLLDDDIRGLCACKSNLALYKKNYLLLQLQLG